jgi:hypothetical protein
LKEAQATKVEYQMGLTTLEKEAAERGEDWEELLEQRAEERARMVALGIDPDSIGGDAKVQPIANDDDEEKLGDDGEERDGDESKDDDEDITSQMNTYATAVRAGAITPQPEDEDHFRARAKLPPTSDAVKAAWRRERTRRPVTLSQSAAAATPPPDESGEE